MATNEEFIEIEQPDSAGEIVIQDGTSTTYAVASSQVETYPIAPTNAEDYIEEASLNEQIAFATGDMTYTGGPPPVNEEFIEEASLNEQIAFATGDMTYAGGPPPALTGPDASAEDSTTDVLPGLPQLGTNLFDKSKETQVSFIYQITKVESTFSKGRFTQELHGVLVPFNVPPSTAASKQTKVDKDPKADPKAIPSILAAQAKFAEDKHSLVNSPVTKDGIPILNSPLTAPIYSNDNFTTNTDAVANYYNQPTRAGSFKPGAIAPPTSDGPLLLGTGSVMTPGQNQRDMTYSTVANTVPAGIKRNTETQNMAIDP